MRIRNLAPISLIVLLAGCWQSQQPLIPAGEADAPPQIAGTYKVTDEERGPDGTATVTKGKASGTFDFESKDPKGLVTKRLLRFDRLSGEWYLVQSQTVDAEKGPGQANYRFLKISGGKVEEYEPACDSTEAVFPGVSVNDGDCSFENYKALKAAAQNRLKMSLEGTGTQLSLQVTYAK